MIATLFTFILRYLKRKHGKSVNHRGIIGTYMTKQILIWLLFIKKRNHFHGYTFYRFLHQLLYVLTSKAARNSDFFTYITRSDTAVVRSVQFITSIFLHLDTSSRAWKGGKSAKKRALFSRKIPCQDSIKEFIASCQVFLIVK